MSIRPATAPYEIQRGRWSWGYEIPWLPDLLASPATNTLRGDPIREAFGRQIAFLRAIAAGAPPGSALQLRFTTDPALERMSCYLLGAAESETDSVLLARVVATASPPEVPLEPTSREDLLSALRAVHPDHLQTSDVVEIRRSIDRLDPTLSGLDRDDPVLLSWTWSEQAMLSSLGLLRQQPTRTSLVIHVEPAKLTTDVAAFLKDEIERLIGDAIEGEEQPLTAAVVVDYRRWLRLLPKGCLKLRLIVASAGPLVPGVPESLSTDLTRSFEVGSDAYRGAAEVLAPESAAELDACALLLEELRAMPWRAPKSPALARLLHIFDPLEAHTAFRVPIAPRGGLPGVASRRLDSLERGAEVRSVDDASVRLGKTPSGAGWSLSGRDLNQHVLVTGLPGFGKTSTVQLLLRRALEELKVPFLVIDPAKDDYMPLMADLAASHDVTVYEPSPQTVAFNPLAVPDGVNPWTHSGRVLAAFDAAFGLSEVNPLAFVYLQRALARVYEDADGEGRQPTLMDLYRTTGDIIRRSSFVGEGRGALEGTLLGRLEVLATATAGRALLGAPDDVLDWKRIVSQPTLISLRKFASPAERSLLFGLLIAGLVSWREVHRATDGLAHLTVLEEAHRLLRPSRTRDAGVEVFVDAIAELRGAGEGFVVVDQTPTLLHPAVMKLTGTKLAHRIVDGGEREAVGAGMVLDGSQLEDLARLGPQRLIAYAATSARATLVDVDPVARSSDAPRVLALPGLVEDPKLFPVPCIGCPVMCSGYDVAHEHVPAFLRDVVQEPAANNDELLVRALGYTARPESAYCLSAFAVSMLSGGQPNRIGRLLRSLQTTYSAQMRKVKTTTTTPAS